MKTLLTRLLLLLLCMSSCQSALEIKVRKSTMQEAMASAAKENKQLIAIVTYDGCPSCEKLVSMANTDPDFRKALSGYIVYEFNAIDASNQWLDQWLFEKAYPTTCVFSARGELITLIKNGDVYKVKNILQLIKDKPGDTAIYAYSQSRLPVKGKQLVEVLNAGLDGYKWLHHYPTAGDTNQIMASITSTLPVAPYFFNNYLLSRLHYRMKDSSKARDYASAAYKFNSALDAVLYGPLRTELKFQADSSYSKYDDPYLAIEQTTYDLGQVERSTSFTASFKIKNSGKKPLIINDVKASCSCTSADWPKKPILPGEETHIDLIYKPNKEGTFMQSAYVISNAFNSAVVISINGHVL